VRHLLIPHTPEMSITVVRIVNHFSNLLNL
jgi:hypothetical protein